MIPSSSIYTLASPNSRVSCWIGSLTIPEMEACGWGKLVKLTVTFETFIKRDIDIMRHSLLPILLLLLLTLLLHGSFSLCAGHVSYLDLKP